MLSARTASQFHLDLVFIFATEITENHGISGMLFAQHGCKVAAVPHRLVVQFDDDVILLKASPFGRTVFQNIIDDSAMHGAAFQAFAFFSVQIADHHSQPCLIFLTVGSDAVRPIRCGCGNMGLSE